MWSICCWIVTFVQSLQQDIHCNASVLTDATLMTLRAVLIYRSVCFRDTNRPDFVRYQQGGRPGCNSEVGVHKLNDNDKLTKFYLGLPTFALLLWLFWY